MKHASSGPENTTVHHVLVQPSSTREHVGAVGVCLNHIHHTDLHLPGTDIYSGFGLTHSVYTVGNQQLQFPECLAHIIKSLHDIVPN